jgi:hypothetical protein
VTERTTETICAEINAVQSKMESAEKRAADLCDTRKALVLELRETHPDSWLAELKERCQIGRSQAFKIAAIADGRTTEEKEREKNAAAVRRHRAGRAASPLHQGSNGLDADTPAEARQRGLIQKQADPESGNSVDQEESAEERKPWARDAKGRRYAIEVDDNGEGRAIEVDAAGKAQQKARSKEPLPDDAIAKLPNSGDAGGTEQKPREIAVRLSSKPPETPEAVAADAMLLVEAFLQQHTVDQQQARAELIRILAVVQEAEAVPVETANLDVGASAEAMKEKFAGAETKEPAKKRGRGRPPGSKNKPKDATPAPAAQNHDV